jgi:integrase
VHLADYCDRYRAKADLDDLVADKLGAVRDAAKCSRSSDLFMEYVEEVYLPFVARTMKASTYAGYSTYLSGIFTYAMSEGHFPGRNALENPASRARIPESAVERVEPKAAARDEVKVILTILKDMPLERAAVAVVAMLGVRPGEARGLRWENWDRVKEQIAVRRAVWHTIEGTPKTTQSVRFLQVSGELREVLLALWKKQKSPVGGYILAAPSGKPVPVILDNLAKRSIRRRLVAVNKEAASRGEKSELTGQGGIRYADSHGTAVRAESNLETTSRALGNSKAVADKHYVKPAEVLPDVRKAVNGAVSGLTVVQPLCN